MINRQFWGMLWPHLTGILINKYALACFNSVSTKNGSFSSNPFPRSHETPPIPKPWATGASGRDSGSKLSAGPSLGQPLQPVFVFRVAGDIWWHPAPPRWVVHWWFYFRVQCRAEYFVTTGPRWSLDKWCEQFQRMQTWCWVQDVICNFFHFLGTLYGCIMLYLVKAGDFIGFSAVCAAEMTSGIKTTTAQRIATTQAEPHPEGVRTQTWLSTRSRLRVCLKIVYPHPMVLLIIIPVKWLFHWEYTQHFQTNPGFPSGWGWRRAYGEDFSEVLKELSKKEVFPIEFRFW